MPKKRLEQQFSEDITHYINGISTIGENVEESSEEYKELLELGKELSEKENCDEACSQRLREKFMMQLEKENGEMKKVKSLKKTVAVAVSVAAIGVVMAQTTFGQNLVNSIIGSFTTGCVTILQLDKDTEATNREAIVEKCKSEPMPEEYKGKIFDKDGKEFEYFPAFLEGAYNAKGEPLLCAKDGEVYTEEEWNKYYEEEEVEAYTEIKDSSKLNDYTNFTVGMPSYLPEGIKFESAGVYSAEDVRDNPCIEIMFTDKTGKEVIYLQERLNCEEAKCETGTYDEVTEVDINGVKGLMYDNSLDWETDETMYMMFSMDERVSKEEMIKVARSMGKAIKN